MSAGGHHLWDEESGRTEKDGLLNETEECKALERPRRTRWHSNTITNVLGPHRSRSTLRYFCIAVISLALVVVGLSSRHHNPLRSIPHSSLLLPTQSEDISPFRGAFAQFPTISSLTKKQRRLSALAIWDNDNFPEYMRHFFYSAQANADSLDLLFINRKTKADSKCIDWELHDYDIYYASNIRVVCMSDEEYQKRHVDLLCGQQYGWGCNSAEYDEVTKSFESRPNERNLNFRPLQGWIFRDLMQDPTTHNWAWLDVDDIIGNLARYPFNVLAKTTMLWGHGVEFECFYLAGQLTAFNFDDEGLIGSFKMIPQFQSPQHFTRNLSGELPQDENEERLWSTMYLQSAPGYPGNNISYVQYPALHGDDFGAVKDTMYVVSGREVLSVSKWWSREQIEKLIKMERATPIDELGSIGWTGGIDGSEYLVDHPELSGESAKDLAVTDSQQHSRRSKVAAHRGLVEDVKIAAGEGGENTCVATRNELAIMDPPIMRTSYVRFKGMQHNHILRRYEHDDRARGWERKLIRHHLWTKTKVDFPRFEITEDLVMRYDDHRMLEVWKMGPAYAKQTLFYRGPDGPNIG